MQVKVKLWWMPGYPFKRKRDWRWQLFLWEVRRENCLFWTSQPGQWVSVISNPNTPTLPYKYCAYNLDQEHVNTPIGAGLGERHYTLKITTLYEFLLWVFSEFFFEATGLVYKSHCVLQNKWHSCELQGHNFTSNFRCCRKPSKVCREL